jgi:6-pyruvoyltetrahydropterin/6-carboxytetrahydropterin synthase
MKTAIFKEFNFSAAHNLTIDGNPCSKLHGHNYKVKIELSGKIDANGMILDFSEIKKRIQPIIDKLDHSYLNETIIHAATSENIASWIFTQANNQLGCVTKVTLWETESCGAIVEKN